MKNKKRIIVRDMLDLVDIIRIIEPDNQTAYQVAHHAKHIIFTLSTGGAIKDVRKFLEGATQGNYDSENVLIRLENKVARDIFSMYLDRDDMRFSVHHHNDMKGSRYYNQVRADFAKLGAEFFVTERDFKEE